jgi:Bacterial Ig domain
MSRRSVGAVAACVGAISLLAPAAAEAAAPVCSPATGLVANVQEGESITLPQAPCTDSDGDPISIEVTQAPTLGTVNPPGTQPIATQRTYTANDDAGGQTDVIKFRAVAGGENSNEATLEINISQNTAPVCPAQVTLTVESGKQLVITKNPCTDADGDPLSVTIVDGPDHGSFNATNPAGPFTYTSQAGFVGQDRVSYRVSDASTQSNVGTVIINVTRPPRTGGGGTTPPPPVVTPPADATPPALELATPRAALQRVLRRGLSVTLTADEPGRAVVRLQLARRDARRLRLGRTVGRLTRTLAAGDTKVAVKLTRKARRKLARVRSLRLTLVVEITDAAGNVRRVTRGVLLRRSP